MILDNEKRKVCEWIKEYTENGTMDIVTGYFTIGALSYLSRETNEKIEKYRFVLGDITKNTQRVNSLDLLNEEISVAQALKLSKTAKEAVEFLKQEKVETKTLEPNFCHAKLYLYKNKFDDCKDNYYISGSSNLTEAGIGLKYTSNVELNIAGSGSAAEYKELVDWFENLWKREQAHNYKTVKTENGKTKEVPFKKYLIDEISAIFEKYSPDDIYLKILSEIFEEENDEKLDKEVIKLSGSEIWNKLFDFQKNAAIALIKSLEKFNGAILADAVGLGKTWTALSVIKFYMKQGREIVVFCPKKLKNNWNKYREKQKNIFEKDKFKYFVRFHTDLDEKRMNNYDDTADKLFIDETPKLFVIDESHNLRNSKSARYKFLLENILQKNENAKVLMLSATPINNSLLDIRNQFKLIPGKINELLEISNMDYLFNKTEEEFKKWSKSENSTLTDLTNKFPPDFLKLNDSLVIARTRNMLENGEETLKFPKQNLPKNRFITPNCVDNCNTADKLLEMLPERFSAYMPAVYAEMINKNVVNDESKRDFFLVRMMHILLMKRLESSCHSFKETIKKILNYHKDILQKVENYDEIEFDDLSEMDDEEEYDFELGKKRKIKISSIKNLSAFKNDLKEDVSKLQELFGKLENFDYKNDEKLNELVEIIREKQKSGENNNNQKALIFTTYSDTAFYLFEQLQKNGFSRIAVVSGDKSKIGGDSKEYKDFEHILQRFAPFTKVKKELNDNEKYEKTLENPIDILIATDCLSEGQNLQDCDFVVNYDIHWNPVRVIQRFGRIDRIGSPNDTVSCVNFFPSGDINSYLNLQKRVEDRMILMKIGGSEIPQFTDSLKNRSKDKELEQRRIERNLLLLQNSIEDVETREFGFSQLSNEQFRQDLAKTVREKYKKLPKAIFSGFIEGEKQGLVALIAYSPKKLEKNERYSEYKLIFIDKNGKEILQGDSQILSFLKLNRNKQRFVPDSIEKCDKDEINKLSNSLKIWFQNKSPKAAVDYVSNLFGENLKKETLFEPVEEQYRPEKWDLICWCLVI